MQVAGAVVGYITNWIAIKLLFDPAEPVKLGPIVVQGLFESRQVEGESLRLYRLGVLITDV